MSDYEWKVNYWVQAWVAGLISYTTLMAKLGMLKEWQKAKETWELQARIQARKN